MARLEIEIAGVNAELKKVLKESKIELSNFNKGLNFDNRGISKTNDALTSTKKLLVDITKLSKEAKASLSGLSSNELRAANNAAKSSISEARAEQARYRAETVRLKNELAAERIEQARANTATNEGRAAQQAHRTEAARLSAQLQALRLQTAQSRTATVAATGSYREAQQTLTALGNSIRNAAGGFNSTNPAIQAQVRQYRELNGRLREFDATMGNHQRSIGNYRMALNGIANYAATAFGFTALIAGGRAVIRNNAEISDSLADVRRTAGLTANEATQLGVALKGINTRTSLKGLLAIATIGGQLGISKNQLAGFTKAVDQLSVSLGSELKGGAEGIAKSLGVLDNVFKISASNGGNIEKAYNQIGSAILQLGQSGLATGDFLADFGERVGGIAKQAGIALPTVLSFGAVLQENGVSAEVAGTAFKRLVSNISSNSAKFFEVAKFADVNLTLDEFTRIINTDTTKALDLFFKGMNKGGQSTVAFNSILKSLKLSGAGVSQVISALAGNLPSLEKHITESTKALEDGTIAAEQFAIKNNNLAASLDKLGNALTNITTNPDSNIGILFKDIVDSFTGGIKVIDILVGKLGGLGDALRKVEDERIVADAEGNIIPLGADAQKEIDDAKKRIKERVKASQKIENDEIKKQRLKVGANLNRDAILDVEAESNATTILAKTTERLALEQKKLVDIRSKFNTGKTKEENNELAKQLISQRELVRLLKIQQESLKPRSNAKAPDEIVSGKKKTGKKEFSVSEEMEKLRKALVLTEVQFGDTFDERNKGKISAYQAAINSVTNALGAQSDVVKNLQAEQQKLFQLPSIKTGSAVDPKTQKAVEEATKKITVTGKVKVPSLFNKEAAEIAENAKRELNRAVLDFGTNFFRTLTNINQMADKSFTGIIGTIGENITGMLQDTFGVQLSNILNNFIETGKISMTNAVAGIAGLAGGFISGATKKTSYVGQAAGGALTGAASGAVIGSAVPGIGTVAGAVVGGLIGALGGLFGAKKARKEEARRQAELEEQKKQTKLLERQNALTYQASIIGQQTNQGIVTGVERNAQGNLVATIAGKDILITMQRAQKDQARGIL